jgi:hypothetical protein
VQSARASQAPACTPYCWASAEFQLGLRPVKADQWILLSPAYVEIMREKRARLRQHGRFYMSLPSSLDAQGELSRHVIAHLVKDHPEAFELDSRALTSRLDGTRNDVIMRRPQRWHRAAVVRRIPRPAQAGRNSILDPGDSRAPEGFQVVPEFPRLRPQPPCAETSPSRSGQ